jgi:hypothetical protein
MRFRSALALALFAAACGNAQRPRAGSAGADRRAKPIVEPVVPPGHVAAVGPLVLESVDLVRHEIGWDVDFVRGTRVVAYEVVVSQRGAACLGDKVPEAVHDARACEGVEAFPAACDAGPPMRARFEVTVRYALNVSQRCAGDAAAYVVREGRDPRAELTAGGVSCFRQRNKLRPETSWTSVYALTELAFQESLQSVTTSAPRLVAELLAGKRSAFCRDDGAYLSGRPGVAANAANVTEGALDANALRALQTEIARGLAERTAAGKVASTVPLTSTAWKSEHDLWEACNAKDARDDVVAQERCQLLRQLDRFLTDVETAARQETPRGLVPTPIESSSPSSPSSASGAAVTGKSTAPACSEPKTSSSAGGVCTSPPGAKP